MGEKNGCHIASTPAENSQSKCYLAIGLITMQSIQELLKLLNLPLGLLDFIVDHLNSISTNVYACVSSSYLFSREQYCCFNI